MSSGIPKYLKMVLNNNLAVIMAVGRPLMESSRQDFENRSTITSIHVLPSESGRSVMKGLPPGVTMAGWEWAMGGAFLLVSGKGFWKWRSPYTPWTNLLTSLAMLGHQ